MGDFRAQLAREDRGDAACICAKYGGRRARSIRTIMDQARSRARPRSRDPGCVYEPSRQARASTLPTHTIKLRVTVR